jgi:hypothetical protein
MIRMPGDGATMKHASCWLGLWCGLGPALVGCVDHQAGVTGTQSIKVELVTPAAPGDLQHRLPDSLRAITVNLTAYDAASAVDPTFERDVEVYAQYLGTVTPTPTLDGITQRIPVPLARVHLAAGRAMNQTVMLPVVYGPTTLWIEDGPKPKQGSLQEIDPGYHPTYVTGTSPILWFRDPFIADIQTPVSETALNALVDSPLENKQITVNSSRYGDVGRLVVTSVFSQGYTVSDVKCKDPSGAPPCVAAAYDHLEVFSFSAPADQRGKLLKQGQLIDGFSGGISEFNGLTEIGFPATTATSDAVTPDHQPAPVKLNNNTWFNPLGDPQGVINFERNEAAPIEIDNALVCPLDDAYDKYKEWKIDPGGMCASRGNVIDVVTAGVIGDLDPATLVGKTLPRVVGVLRPAGSAGNIWIIYPRSSADLTLQ